MTIYGQEFLVTLRALGTISPTLRRSLVTYLLWAWKLCGVAEIYWAPRSTELFNSSGPLLVLIRPPVNKMASATLKPRELVSCKTQIHSIIVDPGFLIQGLINILSDAVKVSPKYKIKSQMGRVPSWFNQLAWLIYNFKTILACATNMTTM